MPATPQLELRTLHRQFGATAVVRDLNLSVLAGERLALIGPNGAGKTTVFNLISGRLAPNGGSIWLQGSRVDGRPPQELHRLGIGRSFQVSQLFPRMTVLDHLRCAVLWRHGVRATGWRPLSSFRGVTDDAQAMLERLGLQSRADLTAQALSYAEQRALEIGMACAGGSGTVLLDEPTAGMSRSESDRCVALIRQLTEGRTLLMVEHDMSVVFQLADRVAVLVDGTLLTVDTPARVRADPRVQAAYLGRAALEQAAAADPGAGG
jgi:branched-chain amino acid transport system ATP-binding protein